jgi:cytochrome c5
MRRLKPLLAAALLAIPLAARADLTERQIRLLTNNCVQCHARPNVGAPLMGRAEDWNERNRQGEDGLLRHVIEGMRGMPPSGYCSACDEADLRALTRWVAGLDGGQR